MSRIGEASATVNGTGSADGRRPRAGAKGAGDRSLEHEGEDRVDGVGRGVREANGNRRAGELTRSSGSTLSTVSVDPLGAGSTHLRHETAGLLDQSLTAGVLFTLAALPCCAVWLAFGASVQRLLRTERAVRRFNLAMSGLLAASIPLFIW
jgi:hypothetical protein